MKNIEPGTKIKIHDIEYIYMKLDPLGHIVAGPTTYEEHWPASHDENEEPHCPKCNSNFFRTIGLDAVSDWSAWITECKHCNYRGERKLWHKTFREAYTETMPQAAMQMAFIRTEHEDILKG